MCLRIFIRRKSSPTSFDDPTALSEHKKNINRTASKVYRNRKKAKLETSEMELAEAHLQKSRSMHHLLLLRKAVEWADAVEKFSTFATELKTLREAMVGTSFVFFGRPR